MVWQKTGGSVIVQDELRILQNRGPDRRAYNAGDQNLTDYPHALKLAGAVIRDTIPDLGAKYGHTGEISGHHQKGTDENRRGCPEEIEKNIYEKMHVFTEVTPPLQTAFSLYLFLDQYKDLDQNNKDSRSQY